MSNLRYNNYGQAKKDLIDKCMDLLEGSYTSKSPVVYHVVENSLQKLSKSELSALYSMLLGEVKVLDIR